MITLMVFLQSNNYLIGAKRGVGELILLSLLENLKKGRGGNLGSLWGVNEVGFICAAHLKRRDTIVQESVIVHSQCGVELIMRVTRS